MSVALLAIVLLNPRWSTNNSEAIFSWDVFGYYIYLPSVFIYQDLTGIGFYETINSTYWPAASPQFAVLLENGNHVFKYSSGMAVLYFPFFILGHLVASITAWPADGFSAPYQFAVGVGTVFYVIAGVFLLRKLLLRYFEDQVVFAGLLILFLGTNFICYGSLNVTLTHGPLFAVFAAILLLTDNWHNAPKKRTALLLGLLIGLATLIRPTEMLIALVPILWGVYNLKTLKNKFNRVKGRVSHVFLLIIGAVVVGSVQAIYWKYTTGSWFYYSYGGQGFLWFDPYWKKILIGWEKGWLVYTPLVLMGLVGIPILCRNKEWKRLFLPVAVFSLLTIYVVCCWEDWRYGGSYSTRALMQLLAVLSIPVCATCAFLLKSKWLRLIYVPIAFLVFINVFQIWQYYSGIIDSLGINKSYYKAIFLKSKLTQDDLSLLDTKEYLKNGASKKVRWSFLENFDSDTTIVNRSMDIFNSGIAGQRMKSSVNHESKKLWFPVGENNKIQIGDWLRVSASHVSTFGAWNCWLATGSKLNGEWEKGVRVRLQNLNSKNGEWNAVHYYYQVPNSDSLVLYVENKIDNEIIIDDLKLEVLDVSE